LSYYYSSFSYYYYCDCQATNKNTFPLHLQRRLSYSSNLNATAASSHDGGISVQKLRFNCFFLNISGVIKSQTIALHISDKKTSLAAVIIIAIII